MEVGGSEKSANAKFFDDEGKSVWGPDAFSKPGKKNNKRPLCQRGVGRHGEVNARRKCGEGSASQPTKWSDKNSNWGIGAMPGGKLDGRILPLL